MAPNFPQDGQSYRLINHMFDKQSLDQLDGQSAGPTVGYVSNTDSFNQKWTVKIVGQDGHGWPQIILKNDTTQTYLTTVPPVEGTGAVASTSGTTYQLEPQGNEVDLLVLGTNLALTLPGGDDRTQVVLKNAKGGPVADEQVWRFRAWPGLPA